MPDRDVAPERLNFPDWAHPPAPALSMDDYVRFLERVRALGITRASLEEARKRKPPAKRFAIVD
jgi:hypothetical protein